ncbi:unnamed protein product [Owenia fusiformis]|uniref:Leishmanolysin-like peptidase n=1 Tax=Owenia fusiformis TaxID=6347 RepID=A0A8J1U1J9_OWEFU|nr:unnamed protein product [Owenia fusiformis]
MTFIQRRSNHRPLPNHGSSIPLPSTNHKPIQQRLRKPHGENCATKLKITPPLLSHIFTLLLILTYTTCAYGGCVSDDVQPANVPISHLDYSHKETDSGSPRVKRAPAELYSPIRIHTYYGDIGVELNDIEQERLKTIIQEGVRKITKILSVLPVRKLLLSRDACAGVHSRGPNKGRCGAMERGYRGEKCLNEFYIPDEHLGQFVTYNSKDRDPNVVYAAGEGLVNTDFVLYVNSRTDTVKCATMSRNVIAYGGYCQTDGNSRPIAGYINICPLHLRPPLYEHSRLTLIGIHEMFHTLGFTKSLFEKYRDCRQSDTGTNCPLQHNAIRTIYGVERLATPILVERTSQHFKCNDSTVDFGVPLDVTSGTMSSHWDAAFLQGSIMTPNFGIPHLTKIDPLTLAVFEDSGWYTVNYGMADPYTWGKGEGCTFGLNSTCHKPSQYFCTNRPRGCHYLLEDKGVCGTDQFLHTCKIYQAETGGHCIDSDSAPSTDVLMKTGEVYSRESRCFYGNLTRTKLSETVGSAIEGGCYQHRCVKTVNHDDLQVKVGQSDWVNCPWGQSINVPGYIGVLMCPRKGILCVTPPPTPTTTTTSTTPVMDSTTSIPSTTPTTTQSALSTSKEANEEDDALEVVITYDIGNYNDLKLRNLDEEFRNKSIAMVTDLCGIPVTRIKNINLKSGSIIFSFELLPEDESGESGPTTSEAYVLLKDAIKMGEFIVDVGDFRYMATSVQKAADITPKNKALHAGKIVGIILGALLLITLIVIAGMLINKYKVNQQVSPISSRAVSCEFGENGNRKPEPRLSVTSNPGKANRTTFHHTNHERSSQVQKSGSFSHLEECRSPSVISSKSVQVGEISSV